MPLHRIIRHDLKTTIFLWKITENLEDLFDRAVISDKTLFRLSAIKSEQHKKGILAVRLLLQHARYSDHDLYYDEFGKPHLADGNHISISHSHGFSGIIISDQTTGIDLELRRPKIALIAEKFIEPSFAIDKNAPEYISKLTVNWGVKEAVFKIRNEKGISFKDHIDVDAFEMDQKKTTACLHFNNLKREFSVYFDEIEDYTLVYVFGA